MKALLLALLFLPVLAFAAPFVVSDPTPQTVTHCGLLFDSATKVDVPVVVQAAGKICKFDLTGTTTGVHTVKATFVNLDPLWGRSESVESSPFTFVRPATSIGAAPSNLIITP